MYNEERIEFGGLVNKVAEEHYSASCHGEEALPFIDQLYKEFLDTGNSINIEEWLIKRLKDCFIYSETPPKWVSEEPEWPYLNGVPMIFICQYTIPIKGNKLKGNFPLGETIYVFGAKVSLLPDGSMDKWTIEYKVIALSKD